MKLILIRHGQAEESGDSCSDEQRKLSKLGVGQVESLAKAMQALNFGSSTILSSEFLRARESADILGRALGVKSATYAGLNPGGDLVPLLEWVKGLDLSGIFFLVGHEPAMSVFASWLISARLQAVLKFSPGTACLLEAASKIEPGAFSLSWLLTPQVLRGVLKTG